MKKVLICLEQLDIGGIETAVITQVTVFLKNNYQVFIAARSGIYSQKLKNMKNVTLIEFDYKLTNRYDIGNEFFEKVIINNEIDEVHVHQYSCVLYLLPVLTKLKIPYVAYVHAIIDNVYEWFMRTYPIYQSAFYLFFSHASKIICITETVKQRHMKLFSLDKEKYLVVPNSLILDEFKNSNIDINSIKNIVFVTRLVDEKRSSIENTLSLLKEEKLSIKVVGDGPLKDELQEKYMNIEFVGKTNSVSKYLDEADLVFAVDRSALEALAMKRLVILSSYNGKMILIDKTNIKKAGKENFSGLNFTEEKPLKMDKILSIKGKKYQKIVEENYKYILENFDAYKKIYMQDHSFIESNNYNFIFDKLNHLEEEKEIFQQEMVKQKLQYDLELQRAEKILKETQNKLDIINSKFIVRCYFKIKNIFKKLLFFKDNDVRNNHKKS